MFGMILEVVGVIWTPKSTKIDQNRPILSPKPTKAFTFRNENEQLEEEYWNFNSQKHSN